MKMFGNINYSQHDVFLLSFLIIYHLSSSMIIKFVSLHININTTNANYGIIWQL